MKRRNRTASGTKQWGYPWRRGHGGSSSSLESNGAPMVSPMNIPRAYESSVGRDTDTGVSAPCRERPTPTPRPGFSVSENPTLTLTPMFLVFEILY